MYEELTNGEFSGLTDEVVTGKALTEMANAGECVIVPGFQFESYGDYYVTPHYCNDGTGQQIRRVTFGKAEKRLRVENVSGVPTLYQGEEQLLFTQANQAVNVEIWKVRFQSENGIQYLEMSHGTTLVWIKSHGENLWLEIQTPNDPLDWGLFDHLVQLGYMPTLEEMKNLGLIFGNPYLDN